MTKNNLERTRCIFDFLLRGSNVSFSFSSLTSDSPIYAGDVIHRGEQYSLIAVCAPSIMHVNVDFVPSIYCDYTAVTQKLIPFDYLGIPCQSANFTHIPNKPSTLYPPVLPFTQTPEEERSRYLFASTSLGSEGALSGLEQIEGWQLSQWYFSATRKELRCR